MKDPCPYGLPEIFGGLFVTSALCKEVTGVLNPRVVSKLVRNKATGVLAKCPPTKALRETGEDGNWQFLLLTIEILHHLGHVDLYYTTRILMDLVCMYRRIESIKGHAGL